MIAVGVIVAFIQSTSALFSRRDALRESAERSCTKDEQQSCQEMYAAIRAARAAEDVVDLGIWQFLAGLVGIYLIAGTLKATRDAVAEANEATEAARAVVTLTAKGQEWDLRAYLVHEPAEGAGLVNVGGTGAGFRQQIVNRGKTPAFKTRAIGSMAVEAFPLAAASIFDLHPLDINEGHPVPSVMGVGPMWTTNRLLKKSVALSDSA